MMKKPLIIFLLAWMITPAMSQILIPRMICRLHDSIPESSGIAVVSGDRFYTHNDSGDPPRFFLSDTTGNILRTITLNGVTAVDFEEITRDVLGNIYIGDFGNNLHNRTDLKIYTLTDPDLLPNDTITPGVISFSYPDQQLFPPPEAEKNFDCEAFFRYGDSLFLFSKNWGTSGFSKVYSLPVQPGTYVAQLTDSIYTGVWITSACINPSLNTIALLSESQVMVIAGFSGSRISDGNIVTLNIDPTQKEGISFVNDTAVYITDERIFGQWGNLYVLPLMGATSHAEPFTVTVLQNPAPGIFSLHLLGAATYNIEVFDLSGKLVEQRHFPQASGEVAFYHPHAGLLAVRVLAPSGAEVTRMVMVY